MLDLGAKRLASPVEASAHGPVMPLLAAGTASPGGQFAMALANAVDQRDLPPGAPSATPPLTAFAGADVPAGDPDIVPPTARPAGPQPGAASGHPPVPLCLKRAGRAIDTPNADTSPRPSAPVTIDAVAQNLVPPVHQSLATTEIPSAAPAEPGRAALAATTPALPSQTPSEFGAAQDPSPPSEATRPTPSEPQPDTAQRQLSHWAQPALTSTPTPSPLRPPPAPFAQRPATSREPARGGSPPAIVPPHQDLPPQSSPTPGASESAGATQSPGLALPHPPGPVLADAQTPASAAAVSTARPPEGAADQTRQVAHAIVRLATTNNGSSMTIQLAPEHLGRVEIHIDRGMQGATHIALRADRPETLSLLQRDHLQLAEALDRGGLSAEGRSFSFLKDAPPQQATMPFPENPSATQPGPLAATGGDTSSPAAMGQESTAGSFGAATGQNRGDRQDERRPGGHPTLDAFAPSVDPTATMTTLHLAQLGRLNITA